MIGSRRVHSSAHVRVVCVCVCVFLLYFNRDDVTVAGRRSRKNTMIGCVGFLILARARQ
jgi:hypothetical protein